MIDDGCLDGVDEIFGYHNFYGAPLGTICYWYDAIMAGCADVVIHIDWDEGDPITAACIIHNALHLVKSEKIPHDDVNSFTICSFKSGSSMDCKPHSAEMTGSIWYLSKEIYELYKDEITHICEGFAKSLKCKINVEIYEEYPPVINHD